MTSPEKILEIARRRVGFSKRRRYFLLFLGIGLFILEGSVVFIFGGMSEAYFRFTESFVSGILFGVMLSLLLSPAVVGVFLFYRKYDYEYILSKRLVELEEERRCEEGK